jgi:hypothetical protein
MEIKIKTFVGKINKHRRGERKLNFNEDIKCTRQSLHLLWMHIFRQQMLHCKISRNSVEERRKRKNWEHEEEEKEKKTRPWSNFWCEICCKAFSLREISVCMHITWNENKEFEIFCWLGRNFLRLKVFLLLLACYSRYVAL